MKEETKKVSEMATAEEVIKSLPGKERPELRWEIYRIISDEFVRRDDKAELAKKKLNLKRAKKAIITLEKHPSFVKFCEQMGIEVG